VRAGHSREGAPLPRLPATSHPSPPACSHTEHCAASMVSKGGRDPILSLPQREASYRYQPTKTAPHGVNGVARIWTRMISLSGGHLGSSAARRGRGRGAPVR
jgi:hypothetical protein